MRKYISAWTVGCLLLATTAWGQTIRNLGAIIQSGHVRGYYYFSSLEKMNGDMINYELRVVDQNLKPVNSVNLVRSKRQYLVESAYNEKSFAFLFYDTYNKRFELITYDSALRPLGEVTRAQKSFGGGSNSSQVAKGTDPGQRLIVPLTGGGFINYGIQEGKKPLYLINSYGDSLNIRWSLKAKEDKDYTAILASEAFQTPSLIGSIITKIKGKNLDYALVVHNKKDGRELFTTPLSRNSILISPWNVRYDSADQKIVVFGEYYDQRSRELKSQSKGFAYFILGTDGAVTSTKLLPWTFISTQAPVQENGKMDGSNTYIYFHDFIRTNDGKIFAIGEQYKKVFDGSGIAMAVLTRGMAYTSSFHVNVYNMVIFQFNAEYEFEKVHFFEKRKSRITLPAGMGSDATKLVAYYVKAIGGFDYAFDQKSKDGSTFTTTYLDYDRSDGNVEVGSITYTPERTFVTDKMKLPKRSKLLYVMRAKPGYIYMMSYLKDSKALDIRLEKVNY